MFEFYVVKLLLVLNHLKTVYINSDIYCFYVVILLLQLYK